MPERLFQIGIKGLILNAEGKILLLSMDKGNGKITWDMPGGRMDENETFEQTLARELQEEVGLDYTGVLEYFDTTLSRYTLSVEEQEVGLLLMTFKTSIADYSVIKLGEEEAGYDWFSPAEASQLLEHKYSSEFAAKIARL